MTENSLVERCRRGIAHLPRAAAEESQEWTAFYARGDAVTVNEGDFWNAVIALPLAAAALEASATAIAELRGQVERLTGEQRSPFVRCGHDLTINRNDVASVEWDRRHYMNGSASWLVITMNDGRQHRIESTYGHYDPVDCSKIEKELLDA